MREKRMREEQDERANKSYMNRWMERAEEEKKNRSEVENQRKAKLVENQ